MKYSNFVKQFAKIKTAYNKAFPNSFFQFSEGTVPDSIFVTLMLQQPNDCKDGFVYNDPMFTVFSIVKVNDKAILQLVHNGDLSTNKVSPFLDMFSIKCQANEVIGDTDAIVNEFVSYIARRKECVNSNKDKLTHIPAKYL